MLDFVYTGMDLLQSQLREKNDNQCFKDYKSVHEKIHKRNTFNFWFSVDRMTESTVIALIQSPAAPQHTRSSEALQQSVHNMLIFRKHTIDPNITF